MSKIISLVFQKRLFAYLFPGFIAATVLGTLSHECGHYFMARYLGFSHAGIGYNYTSWGLPDANTVSSDSDILLTAAGPLETMLTGITGLLLLFLCGKRYKRSETLQAWQWPPVFLAFFWLRELFNLVTALCLFTADRHHYFHGDEFRLARDLGYNEWTVISVAGIAAAFVANLVIFRFVPPRQRLTLVVAGLAGGLSGAWLWLIALGPRLLP